MNSFLDVAEAQIDNCRRQQGGGGSTKMAKIKRSVEFPHQLDMFCLSKQQWWLPFGNSCLLLYSLLERLLPSIRSWLCAGIFIQDVLAGGSFLCWFESRGIRYRMWSLNLCLVLHSNLPSHIASKRHGLFSREILGGVCRIYSPTVVERRGINFLCLKWSKPIVTLELGTGSS